MGVAFPDVWFPYETYTKCAEDWTASADAYLTTYISGALFDENPAYEDDDITQEDARVIITWWMMYGLFMIHGTYPYYIFRDDEPQDYGEDNAKYTPVVFGGTHEDPLWEVFEEIEANTLGAVDLLTANGEWDSVNGINNIKDFIGYDWDA